MTALDIFLYVWICIICCMCSRLCYEVQRETHPDSRCIYCRKLFSWSKPPLIVLDDSEMVDNSYKQFQTNQTDTSPLNGIMNDTNR